MGRQARFVIGFVVTVYMSIIKNDFNRFYTVLKGFENF